MEQNKLSQEKGQSIASTIRQSLVLIRQAALTEVRSGNNISGLLLYSCSTVFVCYWSIKHADAETWNAVFWIIMMFAGINAVAKSFLQESRGRALYYYTLASAEAIVLSRLIYNAVLMLAISFCSLALYSLLLKSPVQHMGLYLLSLVFGSLSLSTVFTLVSALASRAGSSMTLMAVLGIPLLLPLLFLLIRFSMYAIAGPWDAAAFYKDEAVLVLLNVVLVTVTLLVFPYIWRD